MRDRNLDIYRGAIMIYITCFCHLIWWEGVKVGIFEGSWITGIFFAMATVFYIVGASFSLSLEKPFRTYLKGRIKRVAIRANALEKQGIAIYIFIFATYKKLKYAYQWQPPVYHIFYPSPLK